MFGQLKVAQARFQSCAESVETIRPENQGAWFIFLHPDKTTLLPLTASLYVPGRLSDPEKVIVDIGTGYYVEKVCMRFIYTNLVAHSST